MFLVACETSGDVLGAGLIKALATLKSGALSVRGVGGEQMTAVGLASLFPIEEVAAIGFMAVLARLPTIGRRLFQTVDAIVAAPPDLLVLIDAPDFTHRVATRVRRRLPLASDRQIRLADGLDLAAGAGARDAAVG